MDYTEYLVISLLIIVLVLSVIAVLRLRVLLRPSRNTEALEHLERMMRADAKDLREELTQNLMNFNDSIRQSMEQRLEIMRATVDEKLHTTLEKRLGESFAQVSERLEQVHKGLGEMQNLASDVGGLKRILTNVKTRGTWGEVQLGNLLSQMLAPEQFVQNAHIKDDGEVVEYAVKLPDEVLIPIDSKFPVETYERLIAAAEGADVNAVEQCVSELERTIKTQAEKISKKYILPPKTTNFAIMFLPTEGLYAEVMKRPALPDEIQRKHRVAITGPSTLAAYLNALQMGFKTLAIQKRSNEVWTILGQAKTEFEKYGNWIDRLRKNLDQAHKTLDEADTRTRVLTRKLRSVETDETLPEDDTKLLGDLINPTE
ncbi:MAG: DNA recombination protein RmuC [Alphaproteobacteria bacterium]|nr:DNA recombination protein RmuC [Alphaproteobacteria bacterium]